MKRLLAVMALAALGLGLGSTASAKVEGDRSQVYGVEWESMGFGGWVSRHDALVTPETANLAVQSCLRESQESLDRYAYPIAHDLVVRVAAFYRRPTLEPWDKNVAGLRALDVLLQRLDAIDAKDKASYETACQGQVQSAISSYGTGLETVLYGRMHPRTPKELATKNVRVAPLTWSSFAEQVCKLEGYYSTSRDPRLWKLFSLTRTMGNVLPKEADNQAFVTAVKRWPRQAIADIRALNVYSAVAGKYNGPSLGMSDAEIKNAPARLTGVALGSRATSLMAFFTTGWREQLQRDILKQTDYPRVPFQLISAKQVLQAVGATYSDSHRSGYAISQTEQGMNVLWSGIERLMLSSDVLAPDRTYGDSTPTYKETAALAWLALNAETNIRQNEKLGGLMASVMPPPPTPLVFGAPARYQAILNEVDAAIASYRAVDKSGRGLPACVSGLRQYAAEAAKVAANTVGQVSSGTSRVLVGIKFEPVIADIGLEVDDRDDGPFRLHLAMGNGHEVGTEIGGQSYSLWTPSAMVLHLPKVVSTEEWQHGLVNDYDK